MHFTIRENPVARNRAVHAGPYFWLTLQHPNILIGGSHGTLDGFGMATATVRVPAGLPTAFIGRQFYHAYVVFRSRIDFASTPVPLTLTR